MFRNYLKGTLRNLGKYPVYSIINILGLSLGLACFIFIFRYVDHELSYDKYNEKSQQIYRLNFEGHVFEQDINTATVGSPWASTLQDLFPEVEEVVRLRDYGSYIVRKDDASFREEHIIFADSTFFEVFGISMLEGNSKDALAQPNSLVITRAMAEKYFGDEAAIGQVLILDDDERFNVTGIMREIPKNTHFKFDLVGSVQSYDEVNNNQWMSFNFNTYLVLKEGTDIGALESKIADVAKTYIGSEIQKYVGKDWDQFMSEGNSALFTLFPVEKIHLYSDYSDELDANSDIQYVYIFSFIGFFILLLACINYMNLATARSGTRSKEIGVRKVVGAQKHHLVTQFLSESGIMSLIALGMAVVLVLFLLPSFNNLSGKEFSTSQLFTGKAIGIMIFLALGVALIAGSYPAFFLSAIKPKQGMTSAMAKPRSRLFRSSLVVFQFAITLALIVGSMVIYQQLEFVRNKNLGFEKDQVLIIQDAYMLGNNTLAFRDELIRKPQIANATISSNLPSPSSRNNNAQFLGRNPTSENTHVIETWRIDHNYMSTLGLEIVEGRDFSLEFPSDSSAIIINEATAEIFGLEDPIGAEIGEYGADADDHDIYRVIGVVKNFHFESLRQNIGPVICRLANSRGNVALKSEVSDLNALISTVRNQWDLMAPGQPFAYSFMDDKIDTIYRSELRIGRIVGIFTILAILIACLGLLGLAAFTAEQRMKEIGIRKVLGASAGAIFYLMTKEFSKWILIASILALPGAYYFMNKWLQGFAYRVTIGVELLLAALSLGLLITLLTVSYRAVQAARLNPIHSIKHE